MSQLIYVLVMWSTNVKFIILHNIFVTAAICLCQESEHTRQLQHHAACMCKENHWNNLAVPDSKVSAEPIPKIHQLDPCQKSGTTLSAIYPDKVSKPIVMNNAVQQMAWII